MAEVTLSDIYEPTTFTQAVQEAAIESNAFLASGVIQESEAINAMAAIGGRTGELPFYKGLTNDEPNYSSDNSGSSSTPAKIEDGVQSFRKALMNKSWSTMDLARELALADPLGAITGRIGHYWGVNTQARLIQSAMGVLADSVANHSSDLVYNIATDDAGAPTAAELVSPEAVLAAKQTMGDAAGALTAIAMHSVVYTELQRQDVIVYLPRTTTSNAPMTVPDSDAQIPTYLGYRVIVDDKLPAVAGTNRITYTSILFTANAAAYGMDSPVNASELDRAPAAGDGGGQDIVYSRRTEIIHPWGYAFAAASVAGVSPTLAELALAVNWTRVYAERKNIGMAFLQTNG